MSGHTPGLPSVIHPCPTTAEEQERMRDRAWTDLRNADPTLHAEIVRRWNAHADLVAACRSVTRLCRCEDADEDGDNCPFCGILRDALARAGEEA